MTTQPAVRWTELFKKEFGERIRRCPVVYLPLGLCEPHGHIATLGLDLLKAEYLCEEAARRWGGIVAPSQGYHVHEVGFHAPWLADVLGEENACMTSIPTAPLLHLFLYQLRAIHNTGFRKTIVISGHAGGNQQDFRLAADAFMQHSDMLVDVYTDPELTAGAYPGDHAGKYEISQLLYLRPDCVDLSRIGEWDHGDNQTRFAQGEDAGAANASYGQQIIESCLSGIHRLLADTPTLMSGPAQRELMPYRIVEQAWQKTLAASPHWSTASLRPGQSPADEGSKWKPYERYSVE